MPNGQITRYIPGRGLLVVGFKALDANVNFTYSPIKGPCAVKFGQSKNAKEQVQIAPCVCEPISCILYDGGNEDTEYVNTVDDSGEGISLDGGNANTNVCE